MKIGSFASLQLLFLNLCCFQGSELLFILQTAQAFSLSTTDMSRRRNAVVISKLVELVQSECQKVANPQKVPTMQAYVKSDMPMYGIQKPARAVVEKKMYQLVAQQNDSTTTTTEMIMMSRQLYQQSIQSLWNLAHREEKYLAIDFAIHYQDYIEWETLSLYEHMIRDCDDMWWDFVDPIAVSLIGRVALAHPSKIKPKLKQWIKDDNMWMRRTALLAQLKHKDKTNAKLLLDFCRQRMHEREFFIRKAIGWALPEYSKTNPDSVKTFLMEEKAHLSGLSYREGSKHLVKQGLM